MMSTGRRLLPAGNTTRLGSLLIAVTVGVGSLLLTTVTGTVETAVAAGLAGGLLGVTTVLRSMETPVATAVVTLLLPVVGLAGLVALGLPLREVFVSGTGDNSLVRSLIGHVGTTVAIGLATFGVVGTLDAGVGKGAVAKLWQTAIMALLGIGVALGGLLVVQFDALTAVPIPGVDGSLLSAFVFRPTEPAVVVITFWVLSSLLVGMGKILLAVAPIVELSPQTKHDDITRLLSRIQSVLTAMFVLSLGATTVGILLVSAGSVGGLLAGFPAASRLFAAPGLRRGLVAGIGLLTVSTVLFGGLQFATGRVADTVGRLVPSILGGASAVGLAVVATPIVPGLLNRVPDTPVIAVDQVATALTPLGVVLAVIAIAVGVLTGALGVLVGGGGLKYIPRRTAGSAIAGGSLGGGAIAAGVYGGESLVVFAVVAASILVWNIGQRSVTTRSELGALPSVQLEAIHTFSALGLAVGGVILAWGLYTNVLGRLVVSGGTLVGVLASMAGVLLIVLTLRG